MPPFERLDECAKANPDGWGFMWPNNGKLEVTKSIIRWGEYEPAFLIFKDVPVVIHFRTASMGQITQEACHPHRINDNLAFAHNGNLFHFSDYFYSDKRTDSQRFRDFLYNSGQQAPLGGKLSAVNCEMSYAGAAMSERQLMAVATYCIQNYSKMVFMSNQGQVWICNEQAGIWENGCWFSNGGIEHYVGYGYSGAYSYGKEERRHKGGLISVKGFAGDWHQCEYCKGWFKELYLGLCEDCKAYKELTG